jgi:ComF family protein
MPAEIPLFLRRCLYTALDLLFPQRCAGCGQMGIVWCSSCDRKLVRIRGQICPLCGRRLEVAGLCTHCRTQPLPLPVRSYAMYDGPLLRALLHLKYRPNRSLVNVFAGWLQEVYARERWRADRVAAVPLSAFRRRQRGYNQAELIAVALSKAIEIPYDPQALQRVRDTPSQVGLDPTERWFNVSGAFGACMSDGRDQSVLLVDDLITTGATLAACASALLSGGARHVLGLTVARAR